MAKLRQQQLDSFDNRAGCGALGLPEAPVFYPTADEFGDPLEYISRVRHLAEPYGLCRIVPPKGWDPPFALDLQSFSFPTKLQAIHQLQERPAALNPDTFRFEYDKFLESQGRVLESWPQFCGEEMDLCKLYNCVKRHGGYEKVMQQRKWGEVLRMVMPDTTPAALSSAAPANLYHLYEKHLLEYETYRNEQTSKNQENANGNAVDEQPINGTKRPAEGAAGDAPLKRLKSLDGGVALRPRPNQSCEQCHSEAHEHLMMLCQRCDRAWHAYCLSPPLSAVPSGAWFCQDCLASDQEAFGFAQGNRHTLDSFRRMCDRFKKKWFGGRPVTYADVEQEFWQIVERATGPVEVLYGSDLDTSVFGSGFPRPSDAVPRWAKQETWEAHAHSPWNLNNFPKLKGSMLRLVNENIPGVIVPWLYVGMLFSSFCWHYEDHCFYSVNYLHWGEPKCWYSVPGSAYDAFEEVMRSTFPDLFQAQPDLLFQLVTMLNPAVLRDNGVPVCTTLQEAGHFVITFPRSYHGGFNHGFNCAEAVNFAPLDWVPFGRFGVERYRLYHKAAVLSHDELLCVVAKNQSGSSHWLQNEFRNITEIERAQREALWQSGMVKSCRMTPRSHKNVGKEEDAECIICRYYLHLSAVVCSCRPGKAVCLEHAGQLCECSAEKKCLLFRLSLAELEDLSGAWEEERKHDTRKKGKAGLTLLRELADTWAAKARTAVAKVPALNQVEDLVRQAEQFMWAGHEVDNVRPLESTLAFKLNWAKDVAASYNAVQERLHGNKSTRVHLSKVNDLLVINPLPCIEPYASKLKPIVKNACNLQKQIGKYFAASSLPEVRMLQRIQQDVLRLPLEFPEGQKVQEVLSTAQLWSERVQKHLSAGKGGQKRSDLADISQLRDLQSQALKLAVMVPEKRLLDVVVKKAESWLQHARHVLESTPSMQEAEEVLSEGEGFPARLPELEILRKDVLECRSWSARAQAALQSVVDVKDYTAAVKILKDLVEASEGLRIQVHELDTVRKTLRGISWMEKATTVLASRSSTNVLVKLLDEADETECLFSEVRTRAHAAVAWEQKAKDALLLGASYEEFSALLSESSKINVELTGLSEVESALSVTDSWLPRACPFVDYFKDTSADEFAPPTELDNLKDLVSEMAMSPVVLPELTLLRTCLHHLEDWCSQASAQQSSVNSLLSGESSVAQLGEQLLQLEEFVGQGVPYDARLSQLESLEGSILAIKWTIETLELMAGSPTMEDLEVQLEAGKQSSNAIRYSSAFQKLEEVKNRVKTWRSKVTALIEDFEAKVSACHLEQLVKESQGLIVDCGSEVRQIEQILADHRAWQRDVQKVFDGTSTLSLSELLTLQEAGETSLVQSMDVESLDALVVGVGNWLVRCEEAVGTEHSSLRDGLLKLKRSADLALVTVGEGEEEESLCICLHALGADGTTLSCDRCKDRYHPSCMGLTHLQPKALNQQQYTCPFCAALSSGAVFPKDDVTSKISTIQKPSLSCLVELANAAKALRCRVEEEELIEVLLDAIFSWQEWARTFARSVLSANNEADVDAKLLRSALKAACIIGVQEESSALVKQAVAVTAWRHRTRKLLNSSGKPCYRSICRAVQEAVSMGVPSTDSLFQEVQKRESEASTWVNLAQKAIEDEGQMPLESVNLLIAQGDELPVTLTREITALRARSVLYCICRKPYDEARGMIGCDRCGEWYHFSCINLPEPESNDGDCDEILRDELGPGGEFFCPSCKKVGKTRELRLPEDTSRSGKVPAARKKRSTRTRQRTRSRHQRQQEQQEQEEQKHQQQSDAKDSEEESSDGSRARPCRRTAGQHSGFDSFVLVKSR